MIETILCCFYDRTVLRTTCCTGTCLCLHDGTLLQSFERTRRHLHAVCLCPDSPQMDGIPPRAQSFQRTRRHRNAVCRSVRTKNGWPHYPNGCISANNHFNIIAQLRPLLATGLIGFWYLHKAKDWVAHHMFCGTTMKQHEKERANDILVAMRSLCNELETLILSKEESPPEATQPSLVGARIRITKGKHCGETGTVTRRRGSLFWYIKLDDGTAEIYKKQHNFCVLASKEW